MFTTLQHTLYQLSSSEKNSKPSRKKSEVPTQQLKFQVQTPVIEGTIDKKRVQESPIVKDKMGATFASTLLSNHFSEKSEESLKGVNIEDLLQKLESSDEEEDDLLYYKVVDLYMKEHIGLQLIKFTQLEEETPRLYTSYKMDEYLNTHFSAISLHGDKVINDYFVESLIKQINFRVFKIFEDYYIGSEQYKTYFYNKSYSMFEFIIKTDFNPSCKGLQEVWESFFPLNDLNEIKLRVRVIKFIEIFINKFLAPYRKGAITKETENKFREPILNSLIRTLIRNFPGEMKFTFEQIKDWAVNTYLREGTEFVLDEFDKLERPLMQIGHLDNIYYRQVFDGCCDELHRAMSIDFKGHVPTLKYIKDEVYFYMSTRL